MGDAYEEASSPWRCLLDTISHCKQRRSIVSKKARIVSNKTPKRNCKQKKLSCKQEASNCKQKAVSILNTLAGGGGGLGLLARPHIHDTTQQALVFVVVVIPVIFSGFPHQWSNSWQKSTNSTIEPQK